MHLNKAIGNCTFLRSLEWIDVNMPERSEEWRKGDQHYQSRLRCLENLRYSGIVQKGTLKNEKLNQGQTSKAYKFPKVKNVYAVFSIPGEWANMGIGNDFDEMHLTQVLEGFPQLQVLKVKIIKTMSNYQDIINTFTGMSNLQNIHHLEFEYLNCRLSDIEIIAFVHGLMKVKQLKYFSLKIIQNSDISEDCIEKASDAISKFDNLSKFDLYFRRLSLHPLGIAELGRRIENSGNIHCSCSKESIHIAKGIFEE